MLLTRRVACLVRDSIRTLESKTVVNIPFGKQLNRRENLRCGSQRRMQERAEVPALRGDGRVQRLLLRSCFPPRVHLRRNYPNAKLHGACDRRLNASQGRNVRCHLTARTGRSASGVGTGVRALRGCSVLSAAGGRSNTASAHNDGHARQPRSCAACDARAAVRSDGHGNYGWYWGSACSRAGASSRSPRSIIRCAISRSPMTVRSAPSRVR
jgi:hypothetical protein